MEISPVSLQCVAGDSWQVVSWRHQTTPHQRWVGFSAEDVANLFHAGAFVRVGLLEF